jgi:heat shock protein HslJ
MRFSFSTPSLLFQKFGKSMIGNDGCNELFGNFNFDQHHISLKGALGQTKKFCQDTDDVTFKEMLTSSNTYKIGGDTLNLIGPEGRLTFRKEQTPKKAPLIHNDDEEE